MEKLQAALEKARKSRQVESAKSPHTSRHKTNAPRGNGVDTLWQNLPQFDTSHRHLETQRIFTRVAGAKATPFDILRTKVLLQMRQNGWKRLAITSPMPRSGKTTTACNLALGLGRQQGMRSILLDLDLRDPSVSKFVDTTPDHSIGDVLTGDVAFEDQAMRFGDNVAFSMSKAPESDPTRLLLAEDTVSVIDNIEKTYQPDIMIFDLPSMLVNDDTRAFLKNADCALIVARAGMTRYGQFDACEREIAEHTNVVGVVLNAFRYAKEGNAED